jgi:hypothetical protein
MKRLLVVLAVVIIISAAGGGIYILSGKSQTPVVSPQGESTVTPTPQTVEKLTWTDPAGFTFEYPKDITVNKHDEDQVNYAHIELTHKDNPGVIIIWAKDTTAADGAGWVKSEKSLTGGTVFDTSLGGIAGKKVLLTAPKKVVVSAVVDEGVVFYVEGMFDASDYWTKTYDMITASFSFSTEKQQGAGAAGSQDEQSVDEEEVIE